MPALPLDDAGTYVAAAYVVFVLLLVIYIGIMAAKLARISRELDELTEHAERKAAESKEDRRTQPASAMNTEESDPTAAEGTGGRVAAGRELR